MRKLHAVILLVLIALSTGALWLLFGRAPIEEGRCRLVRRKVDPDSQLMWLVQQSIRPLEVKPDGVRDLPAGFAEPRYYTIQSGNWPVLMVADFSQKLVRLCVDTDGDGVLSEERCFTAEVSKETPVSGRRQQMGPISLVSRDSAGKANDGFEVRCFREDARGLLMTSAAFFRTGQLRLAGQTYRVAVVDGDCDGLFNSILSLPLADRAMAHPGCDVFAIDLNRNGTFEHSLRQESEVLPLGKLAKVGDAYYAIDIASDGRSLALSRTEPQLGTLVVEANDAALELKLWSDAVAQHLPQNRQWQLPTGKYSAIHAILTQRDSSGDIWTFSSFAPAFAATCMGPLDFFTIEPGETISLRVGPPFVVKAQVQTRADGRVVDISPIIVGGAGEKYSPAFQRNGQRPPAVAFKIIDEKGTVLVSDKVGYT